MLNNIFKKIKFDIKVIAVDIVLKLKRINIIEAKTEKEKHLMYRLRYRIYNDCGYIDPVEFPKEELKDNEDEHSISFLALKNNKAVGTVNLGLGNTKEDFVTFRVFNIDTDNFLPYQKIGEISRLGILKSEKDSYWIWLGMMKRVYQKSKKMGIECWIFSTYEKLVVKINKKFNMRVRYFLSLEPNSDNLKERKKYKGFFEKFNMSPYYILLNI